MPIDDNRRKADDMLRAARRGSYTRYQDAQPQQRYPKSLFQFIKQNALYILCVLVVVAMVTVLVTVAGSIMKDSLSTQTQTQTTALTYTSPYNWDNLQRNGTRFSYVVDGQVKSRLGVDVSQNQQSIDWNAVAADGIDFAMVRLGYRGSTEGELYEDTYYQTNLQGAKAAGLPCGVYFFSQATTTQEAVEEAEFVLQNLNGASLEYPVVFDSEQVGVNSQAPRTAGLSSEQMTSIAQAFCQRIQQAGYSAMVYGNAQDLARYNYAQLTNYPIWWAEYDYADPDHYLDITMWQYTNGGTVNGISTYVDLNLDLSHVLE